MSMEFEVSQGGGPPVGVYQAKFVGVEETTHDEYGRGSKFSFEVVSGDHSGELATRITGPQPTPANACGRLVAGITGETLKPGTKVDLAPHVGEAFMVQVEEARNGSTRIGTVIKSNEGDS